MIIYCMSEIIMNKNETCKAHSMNILLISLSRDASHIMDAKESNYLNKTQMTLTNNLLWKKQYDLLSSIFFFHQF